MVQNNPVSIYRSRNDDSFRFDTIEIPLDRVKNYDHQDAYYWYQELSKHDVFDIFSLVKYVHKRTKLSAENFRTKIGIGNSVLASWYGGFVKQFPDGRVKQFKEIADEHIPTWVTDCFIQANTEFCNSDKRYRK